MNSVLGIIDTTYDTIIQGTVRLLSVYINAGERAMVPEATVMVEERSFPQVPTVPVEDSEESEVSSGTFKTVAQVMYGTEHQPFTKPKVVSDAHKYTIMYTSTVAVPMFKNPTIEFDAQIATIPYGELLMMHEAQGRFYEVTWGEMTGWVLRDDLVDRTSYVHPQFVVGMQNLVDDVNTARVRAILGDVFGLGRSEFPLQAGEYVLYRLWKKGVRITWPDARPRVPGLWHTILKGMPGVHIGVVPKAGALMEYMINSEIGHLAYVEAVFPDETISISEAHFPDGGTYNERELTREEWRELKPVFITIHAL